MSVTSIQENFVFSGLLSDIGLERLNLLGKLLRLHWARQHVDFRYEIKKGDGIGNYYLFVDAKIYVEETTNKLLDLPEGHPGRLSETALNNFSVDYPKYVPPECLYYQQSLGGLVKGQVYDYGFRIPRSYQEIKTRLQETMEFIRILVPIINLPSEEFIIHLQKIVDAKKAERSSGWFSSSGGGSLLKTLELFVYLIQNPDNREAITELVDPILQNKYPNTKEAVLTEPSSAAAAAEISTTRPSTPTSSDVSDLGEVVPTDIVISPTSSEAVGSVPLTPKASPTSPISHTATASISSTSPTGEPKQLVNIETLLAANSSTVNRGPLTNTEKLISAGAEASPAGTSSTLVVGGNESDVETGSVASAASSITPAITDTADDANILASTASSPQVVAGSPHTPLSPAPVHQLLSSLPVSTAPEFDPDGNDGGLVPGITNQWPTFASPSGSPPPHLPPLTTPVGSDNDEVAELSTGNTASDLPPPSPSPVPPDGVDGVSSSDSADDTDSKPKEEFVRPQYLSQQSPTADIPTGEQQFPTVSESGAENQAAEASTNSNSTSGDSLTQSPSNPDASTSVFSRLRATVQGFYARVSPVVWDNRYLIGANVVGAAAIVIYLCNSRDPNLLNASGASTGVNDLVRPSVPPESPQGGIVPALGTGNSQEFVRRIPGDTIGRR